MLLAPLYPPTWRADAIDAAIVCLYCAGLVAGAVWLGMRLMKGSRHKPPRPPARPGYCDGCGYDLRGGTGRCPECGRFAPTPPPAPATAAELAQRLKDVR